MLVPYKEDGGQWWGRDSYATEVREYAEARAARFTLPVDEKKAAVREWWIRSAGVSCGRPYGTKRRKVYAKDGLSLQRPSDCTVRLPWTAAYAGEAGAVSRVL
jgi:hypothetical protein